MPSLLAGLVRERFDRALTAYEADQLLFLIFCRVDWLPGELKHRVWSRETLSYEFSQLANEGLVNVGSATKLIDANYWNRKLDDFLLKRVAVDAIFQTSVIVPNQHLNPTSPAVTPPAGAGGAPPVAADH